jgi:hypothetical protein
MRTKHVTVLNQEDKFIMDFIPALNDFFAAVSDDRRLNISHLCIYIALFQYWNKNHFQNPFRIKRADIMHLSKIKAKTTYHKCIKELHAAGYIKYKPSYDPLGSLVYIN